MFLIVFPHILYIFCPYKARAYPYGKTPPKRQESLLRERFRPHNNYRRE